MWNLPLRLLHGTPRFVCFCTLKRSRHLIEKVETSPCKSDSQVNRIGLLPSELRHVPSLAWVASSLLLPQAFLAVLDLMSLYGSHVMFLADWPHCLRGFLPALSESLRACRGLAVKVRRTRVLRCNYVLNLVVISCDILLHAWPHTVIGRLASQNDFGTSSYICAGVEGYSELPLDEAPCNLAGFVTLCTAGLPTHFFYTPLQILRMRTKTQGATVMRSSTLTFHNGLAFVPTSLICLSSMYLHPPLSGLWAFICPRAMDLTCHTK